MATKLVSRSLKDWLNKENQSEESFLDMYHESIEMFKDHWSSPSQKNKPRFNQELTEKNNQK